MQNLSVSEALTYLKDVVPFEYLASKIGTSGSVLSHAKAHAIVGGKPYYLSLDRVEKLREAVRNLGNELRDFKFDPNLIAAEQIRDLPINSKYLCTSGLINMGYVKFNTRLRDKSYTSKGREYNYYNAFTEAELKEIQTAIRTIGHDLIGIEIEMEYAPGEEEKTTLAHAFKDAETDQLLQDEIELGLI